MACELFWEVKRSSRCDGPWVHDGSADTGWAVPRSIVGLCPPSAISGHLIDLNASSATDLTENFNAKLAGVCGDAAVE